MRVFWLFLAASVALTSCGTPSATSPAASTTATPPAPTIAVSAGHVREDSVIIWARRPGASMLHVAVAPRANPGAKRHASTPIEAGDDFAAQVRVEGLSPDTPQVYEVWFDDDTETTSGSFKTAPSPTAPRALRLVWGGDVAGQNVCRDAKDGFPILDHVVASQPDVFIALGDFIYADNTCEPVGLYGNAQVPGNFPASEALEHFWDHWRYNRADPAMLELLSSTAVYPLWDDHEVRNDFGPGNDASPENGFPLMPLGLQAFIDHNPVEGDGTRLYGNYRWGQHLEIFVLDNRSYRDANNKPDYPTKTMLGAEQKAWFLDALKNSTATWKLIVSSVPLSIPTGFPPENGRDGWANFDQDTGFEYELNEIVHTLAKLSQPNVLWITTDVHFASVFRYQPFGTDFTMHEIVTGPLNAGLFPNQNFDTTFGTERLFFYGPEQSAKLTWEEAKGWMNFGQLDVAANGRVRLSVINGRGETIYELPLGPVR